KTLNINTLKFYSLSTYTSTIHQFGTTDSYSTQIVKCLLYNTLSILILIVYLHRGSLSIGDSNTCMLEQTSKTL
ncbi:uncharacterized protein FOMMEDRAFT_75579, partial [Fomitiporia mediterranea MF3/22]|uniref:uncharacterized protein n=1 Tax=Fomitiporia mediterranea (strain MF3/22) TaxID=694068 RepID=UPI0004408E6F